MVISERPVSAATRQADGCESPDDHRAKWWTVFLT